MIARTQFGAATADDSQLLNAATNTGHVNDVDSIEIAIAISNLLRFPAHSLREHVQMRRRLCNLCARQPDKEDADRPLK